MGTPSTEGVLLYDETEAAVMHLIAEFICIILAGVIQYI